MLKTFLSNSARFGTTVALAILVGLSATAVSAQTKPASALPEGSSVTSARAVDDQPRFSPGEIVGVDPYLKSIYETYYNTYKIGPGDVVAIHIVGQPDYSLESAKISPMGRLYHPLVGEIALVGLTTDQAREKLTRDFSQYIISPLVTISLIESNSAKVAVLGDVNVPGVVLMNRPMTILDAVSSSGGFTMYGKQSDVVLLRQVGGGQTRTFDINVKRILQGKSNPEDNMMLMAGDTIIVKGNLRKALAFVGGLAGFAAFQGSIRH